VTTAATLQERAIADLFQAQLESLGWTVDNGFKESLTPGVSTYGRTSPTQHVLPRRLREALERLNPTLDPAALEAAADELLRDRSALTLPRANQELSALLRDGVPVPVKDADGHTETVRVRVLDWDTPALNSYLAINEFALQGDLYARRADYVGFVNGLPLLFVELKSPEVPLRAAFDDNFSDYRDTIPRLFLFNALVLFANGHDARLGTLTSAWEHFKPWKRVAREDEKPAPGQETLLRAVCAPSRLLDLVENFTLFVEVPNGVAKIVAQNHQFLGVNNAIDALRRSLTGPAPVAPSGSPSNGIPLGVFWHTQGSGKSYSMVFFSQKALRKVPGNWTFVVVTDREDLDDQIYKTFVASGAVRVPDGRAGRKALVQAQGREHLKQLLQSDHRHVFTLIQKFSTEVTGATYPLLSTRDDVLVMADEAHRSQYDGYSRNLRRALPNARYLAFTGTPLIEDPHGAAGTAEGETKKTFGDYVSIYPFEEAIADEATVPLYYENHLPRISLTDQDLGERVFNLLETADLDADETAVLKRELAKLYSLITHDDRLDEVARDIVAHYTSRASRGKAMVVSIDRFTAVETCLRVQRHWTRRMADLESEVAGLPVGSPERDDRDDLLAWMRATEMAPVISESQGEVEDFAKHKQGNPVPFPIDIKPIRQRLNATPGLDVAFKDPKHPLRMVFVCGMWMTGFDVPSCDVIYLDKPMRNHSLMQTIARANRVDAGKACGMIVDYAGVFHDLKSALSVYANRPGGVATRMPVEPRGVLIETLRKAIEESEAMCRGAGVDPREAPDVTLAERLAKRNAAKEALNHPDDLRRNFLAQVNLVDRIFSALVLDEAVQPYALRHGFLTNVAGFIRASMEPKDVSDLLDQARAMLSQSVRVHRVAEGWSPTYQQSPLDLRQLDIAGLAAALSQGQAPRSSALGLQAVVRRGLADLLKQNPTREELQARFDALVSRYNEGLDNVEAFFGSMVDLLGTMKKEATRAEKAGLTEAELAFRDVLTRAAGEAGEAALTGIAKALPAELADVLTLDWKMHQPTRDRVRARVKRVLEDMPEEVSNDGYAAAVAGVYEWLLRS
jgi:type I restriction enzyme R subunit